MNNNRRGPITFPSVQFAVRFFCSDGRSYRDEVLFPELAVAELYAELEVEHSKMCAEESKTPDVYLVKFEIFPVDVSLMH
jgi:hypothetical protein